MPLRDLSQPIETGMPVYPGDPEVEVAPHAAFGSDGHRVSRLGLGSHAGTHVDAPSHTEPAGRTLDEFEIEDFRFDARRVDLRDLDAREAVSPGSIPETDADLLVLHTGWDEHWGTERYLDHPYLSPPTAERCAALYDAVAVDALNVDPTPSPSGDEPEGVPAHHALLGSGTLVVENLTNLTGLPERFTLHAYPLALDGDGAPVRAVAEFED